MVFVLQVLGPSIAPGLCTVIPCVHTCGTMAAVPSRISALSHPAARVHGIHACQALVWYLGMRACYSQASRPSTPMDTPQHRQHTCIPFSLNTRNMTASFFAQADSAEVFFPVAYMLNLAAWTVCCIVHRCNHRTHASLFSASAK